MGADSIGVALGRCNVLRMPLLADGRSCHYRRFNAVIAGVLLVWGANAIL